MHNVPLFILFFFSDQSLVDLRFACTEETIKKNSRQKEEDNFPVKDEFDLSFQTISEVIRDYTLFCFTLTPARQLALLLVSYQQTGV